MSDTEHDSPRPSLMERRPTGSETPPKRISLSVLVLSESMENQEKLKLHKKDKLAMQSSEQALYEEIDSLLSEGEESDTYEYKLASTVSMKPSPSIMNKLHIPDMSEISDDVISTKKISVADEIPVGEDEKPLDIGKFVNPITGEVIPEEEQVVEFVEEESEKTVESTNSTESTSEDEEISEDSDLLVLLEPPPVEEEEPGDVPPEDDMLAQLLELKGVSVTAVDETGFAEDLEQLMEDQRMKKMVETFVNDVIKQVVHQCEYISPTTILRQNLSKAALFAELNNKLETLNIEQKVKLFLNQKVVEYYRRKQEYRPLSEDNPDSITEDMQRYTKAIMGLDALLGMVEDIQEAAAENNAKLEAKHKSMEVESKKLIDEFETLARRTFHREGHEKYNACMDRYLERIADLRAEISKARLVLIQRQHTFAKLREKIAKIEDLGNGLTVRDYETIQTQVLAVGKKIEERNNDLNRIRTRCNYDLHILSHMREKQHMMRDIIAIQTGSLNDMLDEKKMLRAAMHQLKEEHSRLRAATHLVSDMGGLLDKPALMFDHDETLARIQVLQDKIHKTRKKYADLQERVEFYERKGRAQIRKERRITMVINIHRTKKLTYIKRNLHKDLILYSDEYFDELTEQSL